MNDTPQSLDLTGDELSARAEVVLPQDETLALQAQPGEVVLPEDEDDGEGLPRHARPLADGRILLPLRHKVELVVRIGNEPGQKKVFTELKLRRLNGLDRKTAASQPEDMRTIVLCARSTGMRVDLFNALYENMDAEDTAYMERVIAHFFGLGRRTGG